MTDAASTLTYLVTVTDSAGNEIEDQCFYGVTAMDVVGNFVKLTVSDGKVYLFQPAVGAVLCMVPNA